MTTWMIVEDEPDVYEMLLAVSETLGNEGVAFVDGEEAVAWIDDVDSGDFAGDIPQLALVDIRLPNSINGPMVGARLRQSRVMGKIPVVLMTAWHLSDTQKQEYMAQAGADLMLSKPLPALGVLQKTLEEVVAKRAAGQPALEVEIAEPVAVAAGESGVSASFPSQPPVVPQASPAPQPSPASPATPKTQMPSTSAPASAPPVPSPSKPDVLN